MKTYEKHLITEAEEDSVAWFMKHQKALRDNEKKIGVHFKKFLKAKNFTEQTIAQFEKEIKQIVMKSNLQTDDKIKQKSADLWVSIIRNMVKGTWR